MFYTRINFHEDRLSRGFIFAKLNLSQKVLFISRNHYEASFYLIPFFSLAGSDVSVLVGEKECDVQSITPDLLTCLVPSQSAGINESMIFSKTSRNVLSS